MLKYNWPSIQSTLTTLVAGYGALLATYSAITKWRESRRIVIVSLKHGIPTFGTSLGPDILLVTATNPGTQVVRLLNVTIRMPDGATLTPFGFESSNPLPCDLEPGRCVDSWIDKEAVKQTLRRGGERGTIKLKGVYRDALGTEYVSSPLVLSLGD
jgi:hypothetical protein